MRFPDRPSYQFRFGKQRIKLVLACALTVLGLTFVLGYLLGSSSETEYSWFTRVTEEPEQPADRSTGLQLASVETGTSLKPIIEEEAESNIPKKILSDDIVPSPRKARKLSGKDGAIGIPSVKKLEKQVAISKEGNRESSLRVVNPLGTTFAGLLKPQQDVFLPLILRRDRTGESKPDSVSQANDVLFSRTKDSYNAAVLIPPSLDIARSFSLTHHSVIKKNPTFAALKHDVQSKSGRSQRFTSEGRYYILVGSFANRQVALRQRENLRQNAYPAYLRKVSFGEEGVRHHVLVGRYQDIDRVTEEAGRLQRMENVKPRIFKEGDESIR